jgi:hypothetical protein
MEAEIAWCERVAARLEGGAELFPEGFDMGPGVGEEAIPTPEMAATKLTRSQHRSPRRRSRQEDEK